MRASRIWNDRRWLGLAIALAASPVSAQSTYTWTGAVSGDWTTPGNWNPNGVPGSTVTGDTAIFGASTRTDITIASIIGALQLQFDADAPAYRFSITNGGLYLDGAGIDNLSTSTTPEFDIGNGRVLQILHGTLADSTIVNDGDLDPSSPDDATTAVVTNDADGDIDISYLQDTAGAIGTSFGSLSGSGNVQLGQYQLTIGAANLDDVIDGVIADGGALGGSGGGIIKVGDGALTLTGVDTYTGVTEVQSGTLDVEGSLTSPVNLIGGGLSLHPATLKGGGSVRDISMGDHTFLWPGSDAPDSKLSANTLGCNGDTDYVYIRIGNVGGATHGTYLDLGNGLLAGNCPFLRVWMLSAGVPLAVGDAYLVASMGSATSFTADNLGYVMFVPGYYQAHGHFLVSSFSSFSVIYFILDDLGDDIFSDGFDGT